MLTRPARAALALLVVALSAAALVGSLGASAADRASVFAAASLSRVFPQIDAAAKFSFGGSSALESQILQGAPADVFASASSKQTGALYRKGIAEVPLEFALNRLVLIVPRGNPARIRSIFDVARLGVKLVICQVGVPCGDYARKLFRNLGITRGALRNVVSQTADVSQVVTDVALGQADAGLVYVTDARSAAGRVVPLTLPPRANPVAGYYVTILKGAPHRSAALDFVKRVFSRSGKQRLRAAGFTIPR